MRREGECLICGGKESVPIFNTNHYEEHRGHAYQHHTPQILVHVMHMYMYAVLHMLIDQFVLQRVFAYINMEYDTPSSYPLCTIKFVATRVYSPFQALIQSLLASPQHYN